VWNGHELRMIMLNMKEEWNERAKDNPLYYVSAFSKDWNDESFYRWGEIQTQIVIDVFFRSLHLCTSDFVMLEIGCGAGRMTRALASRFRKVFAYDVSEEYIRIAKNKNHYLKNVVFTVNDGLSFSEVDNDSIDFVFSGWTMQHMPTKNVVIKNIDEIARVLKPGGFYKIDPLLTKHGTLVDTTTSRLLSSRIVRYSASHLGLNKLVVTPTWRGARFAEEEIIEILSKHNLTVDSSLENDGWELIQGRKTLRRWFHGQKRTVLS